MCQLLRPVGRVIGRIEIDRDLPRPAVQPVLMARNHARCQQLQEEAEADTPGPSGSPRCAQRMPWKEKTGESLRPAPVLWSVNGSAAAYFFIQRFRIRPAPPMRPVPSNSNEAGSGTADGVTVTLALKSAMLPTAKWISSCPNNE